MSTLRMLVNIASVHYLREFKIYLPVMCLANQMDGVYFLRQGLELQPTRAEHDEAILCVHRTTFI